MGERDVFLEWLDRWYAGLPAPAVDELLGTDPGRLAVLVVDLLVGFCSEGPLASPRVGALASHVPELLTALHDRGVRHFLLAGDAHPADSPEFRAFPPHCIRGTREAEPVPELTGLSFYGGMVSLRKGSLNVGLETAHPTALGEFKIDAHGAQYGDLFPLAQFVPDGAANKFVIVYPKDMANGQPTYPAPH